MFIFYTFLHLFEFIVWHIKWNKNENRKYLRKAPKKKSKSSIKIFKENDRKSKIYGKYL